MVGVLAIIVSQCEPGSGIMAYRQFPAASPACIGGFCMPGYTNTTDNTLVNVCGGIWLGKDAVSIGLGYG